MKKMIGVGMMIVGLGLLASGYYVFVTNGENIANKEMNSLIKAVTADGVFSENERVHILEVADKYKMDKKAILDRVKEQLAFK